MLGGEDALPPCTSPVNPVWKTPNTYGGSILTSQVVTCPDYWDALPHWKISFSCLLFSDPAVSAWALICRTILPNPSRFSWSCVPWGLVLRSFLASQGSWPYLSCCMVAGLALLQGHNHPVTGRRRGKIIWVSDCPKIWLGTHFHRKMSAKWSTAGRAC